MKKAPGVPGAFFMVAEGRVGFEETEPLMGFGRSPATPSNAERPFGLLRAPLFTLRVAGSACGFTSASSHREMRCDPRVDPPQLALR